MGQGQARVARWLAWVLAGLLGLLALPLVAAPRALNEYSRDVWTTRQGLPHNLVSAIAQTPEGYLWLGTWEGLARYNGLDFRTFDRGNVPVLEDNGVRVLRIAADGALWMGTSRGGIYRHAGGEWTALTTRQGLGQDEIMDLVPLADGGLWIATESAGVDRYDGRSFRHFRQADGLPSDVMYCVALGADGERLQIVFVSVDPDIDTPASVGNYADLFHANILGLTGTPEHIARIASAYRVVYAKVPQPSGGYNIDHSTYAYLVDDAGRLFDVISPLDSEDGARAKLRRLVSR